MLESTPEAAARRAGGASRKYIPPQPEKPPAPLRVVNPTRLQGLAIPDRRWIVPDWLPVGHTTINFGDGGTGKTLAGQQLMTSCATGSLWFGLSVTRCRTFGLFCEDDEDELHRRQDHINQALGICFDDLEDMRWASGVGEDNILMSFPAAGEAVLTPRYDAIVQEAKAFGAKLVVIDTAADTFGGNENARPEVRRFIGRALNHLAREIGGAVLLNAHPSVRGMSATGDMDGGSTAWSNTARSRWSLSRKVGEDGHEDPDERVLTKRKANYAQKGTEIRLRWKSGVLTTLEGPAGFTSSTGRSSAEDVFLQLLDEADKAGRRMSESKNATNFAPKVFAKSPNAQGYSLKQFHAAMERLFATGKIMVETYGRVGDARQRIVRTPHEPDAEA